MQKKTIDMPDDLIAAISAQARQDGRRFGPQVVWMLRQYTSGKILQNITEPYSVISSNIFDFTSKQRQQLIAIAGDEETLAKAISVAEGVEPGKMKSPFGYVKRVLENWSKDKKILQNNISPYPVIHREMTDEEKSWQQEAREAAAAFGWGD